jgi:vitamin B12 transporter
MPGLPYIPRVVSQPPRLVSTQETLMSVSHVLKPVLKALPGVMLLLTLGASPLTASDAGSLKGRVVTALGQGVPQISVRLSGPMDRVVTSGPSGFFETRGLQPGEYRVEVATPGITPGAAQRVVVHPGGEATLEVTLVSLPLQEQVAVTATRSEAASATSGNSTAILDRAWIDERRAATLLDLLQDTPGLACARAGGVGLQASSFVRGGESRFALVLVDGVPINEPGGGIDLGDQLPFALEQVEVVRGAVSALYGTDALAGVIHLRTRSAGTGRAVSGAGEIEAGSLRTQRTQAEGSLRRGPIDLSVGASRFRTDNQEPNSDFDLTSLGISASARLSARSSVRSTMLATRGDHGAPGATAFVRPDLDARYDRDTLIGGVQLKIGAGPSEQRISLGYSSKEQLSTNPRDSGAYAARSGERSGYSGSDWPNPLGFQNDTQRLNAGYQMDLQPARAQLITLGASIEREQGIVGDRRGELLRPERTNWGVYAQDRLLIGERLFLTLGGRIERNGSYGTAAVPRVALAWHPRWGGGDTILRASAGTGIKEPGFLESYGLSLFARGNPELRAERSRTADVGIERRLMGNRLMGRVTVFHQEYRNQIAYTVVSLDPYQGSYVNLGQTRARGTEFSLHAQPIHDVELRAEYTYLDGRIKVSPPDFSPLYAPGRPLLRRPKHQASVSLRARRGRFLLGATLTYVGHRADGDFYGLGLDSNAAHTLLGTRLSVRVNRFSSAFLVGDNALNRRYEDVLGYPALGRTLRVGITIRTEDR